MHAHKSLRKITKVKTMGNIRSKVFISCGQRENSEEVGTANKIVEILAIKGTFLFFENFSAGSETIKSTLEQNRSEIKRARKETGLLRRIKC